MIIEEISGVLEKLLADELQMSDDQEESVFNSTITSQLGQEIARHVNARNRLNSESEKSPTDFGGGEINIMNFNGDTQVDTAAQPNVLQIYEDMGQEEITTGPPPMTLHVGNRRTQCHLMKSPRPKCCLRWSEDCEHCTYKNAKDERWKKQLIILAAENACAGIYNFIVPLRSHFISMNSLSPIILLLEADLDDLLLAGINKVSHLVIANNESPMDNMEETMTDSRTIVATQTILR
ncbi:hypothetical protein KUTeg_000577 [Tegillarca granosa]|uniref:Uncharacterized protein n=1 Tax=Tegillarca granosa TaxID=220873 RepID=A0ABQ9G118_TEGGR|nr:hypothetical protein KUTeg_000577 [Tegillarca granosa]